jgi:basic amino acid/polyamine antiporter, APA family
MAMKAAQTSQGHLARILGLGFGFAVIFGGTVGVGILRLPGEIAGKLGSPGLIMLVWAVGGLYSLLGAISLSEMGAALPQAGGFYVYSKRAFGPAAGFAMGWADWMINCASIAYAARAASEYLAALTVGGAGFGAVAGSAVALGLLGLFCGLHWFGLRLSSGIQKTASAATAITFLVLAGACLLHRTPAAGAVSTAVVMGHGTGWLGMVAPIIAIVPAIVVAYDGWYEAIYFTEEDTNAASHLPKAMIGSVLLITGLYLLLNLAFLHVLPMAQLGQSQLAAADAARVVFPAGSGEFITVLSLLTLLSLMNALLLGAPRILFAVGRDGLFPDAARVAEGGTPRTALLVTAAMIAAIILSGKFDEIVAVAAILMALTYTVNYVAVFVLRTREPELARPFRAWGFPVTTGAVLLGSFTFVIADVVQDPATAVRAAVLLGIAVPVYWWMRRQARAKSLQQA